MDGADVWGSCGVRNLPGWGNAPGDVCSQRNTVRKRCFPDNSCAVFSEFVMRRSLDSAADFLGAIAGGIAHSRMVFCDSGPGRFILLGRNYLDGQRGDFVVMCFCRRDTVWDIGQSEKRKE